MMPERGSIATASHANPIDRLAEFAALLGAWLFAVVAVAICYEVVWRYLLNAPSIWVEELTLLAQLWATYLGAAYVLRHDGLIRITVIREWGGERVRLVSDLLALVAVLAFSLLATWFGMISLIESLSVGRASASLLMLPAWTSEAAVPIGFGLLSAQALLELVRLVRGQRRPAREVAQ
ncbi:TRAP transporter small permease [Halotalea alkalilenta]|uniref:TRAP transporter small permease n=1 Tax=Halotalea alkalilenta TaxID=376489 RepID=UPI0006936AFA|nr:TRAP transporter small permease [Halotalea alkalilenta]